MFRGLLGPRRRQINVGRCEAGGVPTVNGAKVECALVLGGTLQGASDASALKAGLERQRVTLASARQFVSDELEASLVALRDLRDGCAPDGDREIVLDKHQQPKTTTVQVDGEIVQVAVTRMLIPGTVRRQSAEKLIDLAGVKATTDAAIDAAIDRQKRLREQVAGIPVSISKIMLPLGELVALARDEQRSSEQQRRELQAKYGSMTPEELKAVAEGPSPRHEPLGDALAGVEAMVMSIVAEHVCGGGSGRRPLLPGR